MLRFIAYWMEAQSSAPIFITQLFYFIRFQQISLICSSFIQCWFLLRAGMELQEVTGNFPLTTNTWYPFSLTEQRKAPKQNSEIIQGVFALVELRLYHTPLIFLMLNQCQWELQTNPSMSISFPGFLLISESTDSTDNYILFRHQISTWIEQLPSIDTLLDQASDEPKKSCYLRSNSKAVQAIDEASQNGP